MLVYRRHSTALIETAQARITTLTSRFRLQLMKIHRKCYENHL